jgi:DNA-binding transcriptional LysR family regulator
MDLRELGYFVAVFEEHSVSAAARRCFVSQPSVSEALASLEHALSVKLFVRHRKGVTATAAGEQLYPIAHRLVSEVRALPAQFTEPQHRRPLRVALMRSLDVVRTRDLLARATHAGAELLVVDEDDEADLRVASRVLREDGEAFIRLWDERYVVALPRLHPLARKTVIRAADLVGQRIVMRCHCEAAERFRLEGAAVNIVAVATSEEWAVALVSAGIGIAVVPEGTVSTSTTPDVVRRPLREAGAKREVGILYRPQAPRAVRQLAETLAATAPSPVSSPVSTRQHRSPARRAR